MKLLALGDEWVLQTKGRSLIVDLDGFYLIGRRWGFGANPQHVTVDRYEASRLATPLLAIQVLPGWISGLWRRTCSGHSCRDRSCYYHHGRKIPHYHSYPTSRWQRLFHAVFHRRVRVPPGCVLVGPRPELR